MSVSLLFSKIRFWRSGPLLKNSSGVIEARNSADSAYAIVRGGTPSGSNDLGTKGYVDTAIDTDITAAFKNSVFQDGTDATKQAHLVLSGITTGNNRAVTLPNKDITVAGTADITAAVLNKVEARRVALTYTQTGANNIGAVVPAGAVVIGAFVVVGTTFNGTTPVIALGKVGAVNEIMATTDSDLTSAGASALKLRHKLYSAETQLIATITIGGSPSQGTVDVIVLFVHPAS